MLVRQGVPRVVTVSSGSSAWEKPRNILQGLQGVMAQCINSKQGGSTLSVNAPALRRKLMKSLKAISGQDLSFRIHPKGAF